MYIELEEINEKDESLVRMFLIKLRNKIVFIDFWGYVCFDLPSIKTANFKTYISMRLDWKTRTSILTLSMLKNIFKMKLVGKTAPSESMLDLSECLTLLDGNLFSVFFMLQAKLKSHIQNPSAADLVHFLFTPLNMVRFY